jgi:hypothetical protein
MLLSVVLKLTGGGNSSRAVLKSGSFFHILDAAYIFSPLEIGNCLSITDLPDALAKIKKGNKS